MPPKSRSIFEPEPPPPLPPELIRDDDEDDERTPSEREGSVLNGNESLGGTVAENCRLIAKHGGTEDLGQVNVRREAYFWIEAVDALKKRRSQGGDAFFVTIRGPATVRARITDNQDGTYLVQWKPSTSGMYTVAVSLFGTHLPLSPMSVVACTSMPCPSQCRVRGEHLKSAVSRQTHFFEVLFKDALAQIAHAVDLDVFVEPLPPSSPRIRKKEKVVDKVEVSANLKKGRETKKERERREAREREAEEEERIEREERAREKERVAEKKKKIRTRDSRDSKEALTPPPTLNLSSLSEDCFGGKASGRKGSSRRGSSAAGAPGSASQRGPRTDRSDAEVIVRHRTMRVKVGDKALLVRAEAHKGSAEVGRLMPGQVVTIIEERLADDGEVRARIALDSIGDEVDDASASHRSNVSDAITATPNVSHRGGLPLLGVAQRAAIRPPLPRGGVAGGTAAPAIGSDAEALAIAACEEAAAREAKEAASEEANDFRRATFAAGESATRAPTAETPPAGPAPSAASGPAAAAPNRAPTPPLGSNRSNRSDGVAAQEVEAKALAAAVSGAPVAAAPGAAPDQETRLTQASAGQQTGWVTLVKNGQKLVSSRVKLGPGSRRLYMEQWARRKATDKVLADGLPPPPSTYGTGSKNNADFAQRMPTLQELEADPAGIAFAFGGMEPGILHAHGQLHEVHKVSYSIGVAGQYLLHIRFRQQAITMPGSPFQLTVVPAAAYAASTKLQAEVLHGMVGLTEEDGCECELRTADKMGNFCIEGGSKIRIVTGAEADITKDRRSIHKKSEEREVEIDTEVIDKGDGSYVLRWRSKYSGVFRTRVLVDEEDVQGSPTTFSLTSSVPDLLKTVVEGDGLNSATAGEPSYIRIAFVDQFHNTAIPSAVFTFGLAVAARHGHGEREKVANVQPHAFEGDWEGGNTGVFELHYVPTHAGNSDLHVWCDPDSSGQRVPVPGSPFPLHVCEGPASADCSIVDGWSKVHKEDKNDKYGKNEKSLEGVLLASDTVSIRPLIFDQFNNSAVLPEEALVIKHRLPSGDTHLLGYTQTSKGGTTTYDIRQDTVRAGEHEVHILLHSTPIQGSPVTFTVLPSKPDPPMCKLLLPEDETLWTDQPYIFTLKTYDKFGNECKVGGLSISNRLQLVKQSARDQTSLVPSNHSNSWEDNSDGSYSIRIVLNLPCTVKLIVNIDKNLQAGTGELPPHSLTFNDANENADGEGSVRPPAAAAKSKTLWKTAAKQFLSAKDTAAAAEEERVAAAETDADGGGANLESGHPVVHRSASFTRRRSLSPSGDQLDKKPDEVALAEDVPSFNNWLYGLVSGAETIENTIATPVPRQASPLALPAPAPATGTDPAPAGAVADAAADFLPPYAYSQAMPPAGAPA